MINCLESPESLEDPDQLPRPQIARWFRSKHRELEGVLIWKGFQYDQRRGDYFKAYVVREECSGERFGVAERRGLIKLGTAGIGAWVHIEFVGRETDSNGFGREVFSLHVEQRLSERTCEPSVEERIASIESALGCSRSAVSPSGFERAQHFDN